jgi:hypothetical protein
MANTPRLSDQSDYINFFPIIPAVYYNVSTGVSYELASSSPSAPTNAVATSGLNQASVSFTGSTGASYYLVTSSPGGVTAYGSASPIVVTGLANNTAYTFKVKALNSLGNSSDSSSSSSITVGYSSFPTAALTANTQTLSDGPYVLTTSSSPSAGGYNTNIFQAFDQNTATNWGAADGYSLTTGAYTGSVSTTLSDSSTVAGCWLQIQLPKSIQLSTYTVGVNWAPSYTYEPSGWKLLGSVNGSTWYLIDSKSGLTTSSYTNGVLNVTPGWTWGVFPANYYRLVITGGYIAQANTGDFVMINELKLNGVAQS